MHIPENSIFMYGKWYFYGIIEIYVHICLYMYISLYMYIHTCICMEFPTFPLLCFAYIYVLPFFIVSIFLFLFKVLIVKNVFKIFSPNSWLRRLVTISCLLRMEILIFNGVAFVYYFLQGLYFLLMFYLLMFSHLKIIKILFYGIL